VEEDWARRASLIIAPTLVLYAWRAAPLRIGIALPWSAGVAGLPPTVGAMLRVIYEATAA
jgi:hypothetical protein